jgi:tricorn protease
MRRVPCCAAFAWLLATALAVPAPAPAQIDARMLRQPDVSATQIAFVYAGDIWIVAKSGGVAQRLSSPAGEESFPRFSPDGKEIAFTGDYDGNQDVYVMPTGGGVPRRTTHHPAPDRMLGWYPDGQSLLIASPMASGTNRFFQLYKVGKNGGLPLKLAVPYGEFGAISPDGQWLAYMPQTQDFRTWKRYRGGWASHLWLYNLTTGAWKNVSTTDANDAQPMWHGKLLYFLSDRGPAQRANIWAFDPATDSARQVTRYADYDIHFPSSGPTDIVFEKGGRLFLLDLASEQAREVPVQVVTDLTTLKPRLDSVGRLIQNAGISPTGKRAVFEARGDVFTLPAENGPAFDLTRTSGAAERFPAWSPDGKWIAYWSDQAGEYELAIRPADGSGAEEQLTHLGPGFRYHLFWSPDGKKLAFIDQTMAISIFDRDSKKVTPVDREQYYYEGGLQGFTPSWSADSRWLAYARDLPATQHRALFLFDTKGGTRTQVTTGFYDDFSPVFDPDGKYLYFYSNRHFQPVYSDVDNTWVYPNATSLLAIPLRTDVASPLAPKNDEEPATPAASTTPPAGGAAAKPKADSAKVPAPPAPVNIDLEGLETRAVALPIEPGNYGELFALSGKVMYRRIPRTGSTDKRNPVVTWDLKDRKEETILEDADGIALSANREKLLAVKDNRYAIVDVKPGQKLDKPLATAGLTLTVDPRAEWQQVFNDVWRFERDYFYDPQMHGVDWKAARADYQKLLDAAVTRWDVNFVIGELISELSASHTYRGGGDLQPPGRRGVGLLGADWSLENGAYRVKHIVDGAPWDDEVRSPLRTPGVNVKEGDYLLAVNGVPVDATQDPWAALDGLADQTVQLTVNDKPTLTGARRVLVKTLSDESRLRNLEWIDANRRRVDVATHGRVGYVYVPSTGVDGQTELLRQFLAQFGKDGMIVDERFNSGGQIPDRFVELLNRPPLAYYAVRDGLDWQWPPAAHFGAKVMLINGWSGSGGDAFPTFFREAKLGPLIGTRTWGGIIGISGVPGLIDGGAVTVPTFRQYDPRGKWFAEGHGVEPDLAVVDDPSLMARGGDPQLERGIQEVLRALQEHPYVQPKRPAYEDRTAKGRATGRN